MSAVPNPPPTPDPAPPPDRAAPPPTPEYVFREFAPRIYNIARRVLGNDADAEDVTQDVLLQVVRKLHTFRGDASLPTWLHKVTVNSALAHRERRANRNRRETATGDEQLLDSAGLGEHAPPGVTLPRPHVDAAPDDIALAVEQRALIDKAIARLPEGTRELYVLADVEGLPNGEIADILGMSVSAVKSRLHRARLRMRELLAPHFEGATP
ncbi:RNA polymerase sigma factor [Fimbriiglobus ruber]|uniref:RNA polymerase sigma-70 factor n=1 Tax=Fimbriiglobus ruber TaxID=1908690 RepID=A0A225DQF6_9BACT|nr:sigma-70 family RNA polymerase sigma factor [Fimbriiglobus ruber]OWK43622.1 RNA polymerase sigma-70 factor [Fimbriiglobus ruber]